MTTFNTTHIKTLIIYFLNCLIIKIIIYNEGFYRHSRILAVLHRGIFATSDYNELSITMIFF